MMLIKWLRFDALILSIAYLDSAGGDVAVVRHSSGKGRSVIESELGFAL